MREPLPHRPPSRLTERHRPLPASFPEHDDNPPLKIHIVDVEPAQLGYPYAGRVQQFEQCVVTESDRILLGSAGRRRPHQVARLVLPQHRRQHPPRPRRGQPGARVSRQVPTPVGPGGEGVRRRRPPSERGPTDAGRPQRREPRPQHLEIKRGHPTPCAAVSRTRSPTGTAGIATAGGVATASTAGVAATTAGTGTATAGTVGRTARVVRRAGDG